MFDLDEPVSPLRGRFRQMLLWLALPSLTHPEILASYLTAPEAGEPSAQRANSGPPDPAHLRATRTQLTTLLLGDLVLSGVAGLLAGEGCVVPLEVDLLFEVEQRRRASRQKQVTDRAAREEVAEREAPYAALNRIPTPIFGLGLAVGLFAVSVLFLTGYELAGWACSAPLLFGAALLWISRVAAMEHEIALVQNSIAQLDQEIKLFQSLAMVQKLIARNRRIEPAGGSEEDIRAAARASLEDCSLAGAITDLHYFVCGLTRILDNALSDRDERILTLPAGAIRELMADNCEPVFYAFSRQSRAQGPSLKEGVSAGHLSSFDLVVGPEDLVEFSCHLAGETDLTVVRLPLSSGAVRAS